MELSHNNYLCTFSLDPYLKPNGMSLFNLFPVKDPKEEAIKMISSKINGSNVDIRLRSVQSYLLSIQNFDGEGKNCPNFMIKNCQK